MLAVAKPEIPEVMDTETGKHHLLAAIVGNDRDTTIQRRMAIKEAQIRNRPLYVCSECLVPVSLLMHPDSNRFYFKHIREDGRCSAITRGQLSHDEIKARKYNGTKESIRHRKMKAMVLQSLRADRRFSDIKSEKRWTGELDGRWRQPDVQAVYDAGNGSTPIRVAFEVQLSTTFLDVIAERRIFYRNAGALLFWIFAEFNETGRRLMQDDVFYNNNQNAFLVNEETTTVSKQNAKFHLACAWSTPRSDNLDSNLNRQLICFHDVRFDIVKQQAYYFDVEAAHEEIFLEAKRKRLALTAPLKKELESFLIARNENNLEDLKTWKQLRWRCKNVGIELPEYASHLPNALLSILYSAKYGRLIGWDYSTLVQLGHWVVTKYPQYLFIFRKALLFYDRAQQIETEDVNGKWRAKVTQYKARIKAGDQRYAPDTTNNELIDFLFPELSDTSELTTIL